MCTNVLVQMIVTTAQVQGPVVTIFVWIYIDISVFTSLMSTIFQIEGKNNSFDIKSISRVVLQSHFSTNL